MISDPAAFELQSGRTVFIRRVHIEDLYAGAMEGSPATIREYLLRDIPDEVAQVFARDRKTAMLVPEGPLPRYWIAAVLDSSFTAVASDGEYSSKLVAVVFTDDLTRSIGEILREGMATLD
jgi:hypothetical protein